MPEALTRDTRKARGAFFTPAPIAKSIVDWAVRCASDRILDPSCGDAAFLLPAATKLLTLSAASCVGGPGPNFRAQVNGVDIDSPIAKTARERLTTIGVEARIEVSNFFDLPANAVYDAVIGNPPYIRYQGFNGTSRTAAREAAARAGVSLTALASSWAPFIVHASQFLRPGGRLGFVLPTELLSVNYAAPIRRFLFNSFASIELVFFERLVFKEAEANVILLLADGYGGSTSHATIRRARDESDLSNLSSPSSAAEPENTWSPLNPEGKWTELLAPAPARAKLAVLRNRAALTPLSEWGSIRLGAVTGNNSYFTLSPLHARELALERRDLVRISPSGSAHLHGLSLTSAMLTRLGKKERGTLLFRPREPLSFAAKSYVQMGREIGVDLAYKCRARKPWYIVPLPPVPNLLLTAMNTDSPRIVANAARVHHLNSVYGVYLSDGLVQLGTELLPLAGLNSASMLSAELSGRSYGGGILKLEPREMCTWLVPSPRLIRERAEELRSIKGEVGRYLRRGQFLQAIEAVDGALGLTDTKYGSSDVDSLFSAAVSIACHRKDRGRRQREKT